MKFIDGNGNLEILIYVVALILGLVINVYRNFSKRRAKEMQKPSDEEPIFPEVLFEPVFQDREMPDESTVMPEDVTEYTGGESEEYSSIDTVPKPEESLESLESSYKPTEPIDTPLQEEGVAAFASTSEQIVSDDIGESLLEITAGELYNAIADSEDEITGMYTMDSKEEDEFDLGQAVIYSEILNPKYTNNGY